ncbi:MAG: HAD family hydrolase [Primorskyibacter sp.]
MTQRPDQIEIQGVLFDKDGTLFDFSATWDAWAAQILTELSEGDEVLFTRLASAIDYDWKAETFRPESIAVAGTHRETAMALVPLLPRMSLGELEYRLSVASTQAPLTEAVTLAPFLAELSARGLGLGVMTNDSEAGARAHLSTVGVLAMFDFVAGFDSGYGAKPAPDPLLAGARALGVAPAGVIMVGDSTHDLLAGRAAGMRTVGVLTGMAGPETLAPLADVVLPDVGHLPSWIDAQNRSY